MDDRYHVEPDFSRPEDSSLRSALENWYKTSFGRIDKDNYQFDVV